MLDAVCFLLGNPLCRLRESQRLQTGELCAIPADEMGMDGIPHSGQLKIIAAAAGCYFPDNHVFFEERKDAVDCYPVNFYLRFQRLSDAAYIDRLHCVDQNF